jgi:large subunit ribosomal protein L30
MTDVQLKQIKSSNGSSATQRATLRSLKLGRIGRSSKLADSPQVRGMIRRVSHLVEVEDG